MPAKSFGALYVLSLAVLACGGQVDSGGSSADPHPAQMLPNNGYVGTPTPVVIAGTGFLVKTVQGAGGGPPTVDTTHRAWLGDTVNANQLQSVTWVNDAAVCGTATPPCLTATVPTGLTPGLQALTVENAFGLRGRLENAFTVVSTPLGILSATIVSDRSTVSVGQVVTLNLTVTNTGDGTAEVTAVTPSAVPAEGSSASATCSAVSSPGTTPAVPQTVAGHASVTFSWTCTPTAAGALILSASVEGADSFTNLPLSATPATVATVTVQSPASLTAALQGPGSVAFGSFFTIVMTVTNPGEAAVNEVAPTNLTVNGTGQAGFISGPTPAKVTVPGAVGSTPGTATFSWIYKAGTSAGTLVFSGGASGTDANSGAAVTAPSISSNQTTIAPLAATLTGPTTVTVSQPFQLTLTVTNGGAAAVDDLTPETMVVGTNMGAQATRLSGPNPASVASLAGCTTTPCTPPTTTFTWSYMATSAGQLSFHVKVNGTDHLSGQPVSADSDPPQQVQVLLSITGSTATPPRGSLTLTASGSSGSGYFWTVPVHPSGVATIVGSGAGNASGVYTAGTTGNVTDIVQVTDSLGNAASVNITVTAGASISPSTASVAPLGSQTFTASGGSGAGYTWLLTTNASGGSINASTGVYTAGSTGNVTDVVHVTDSLGNTAAASVTVTTGVSISPPAPSVAPRGTQTFTATGGSGAGYSWSLTANNSGGSINATTGAYTAGATGGVIDVVLVTDSLGNTATASVTVTAGVSISPPAPSVAPRGTLTFTATGGSGTGYAWSLTANPSGGSIDPSTGAYTAGAIGGATDVALVTDSLGNTATVNIAVTVGVSISPPTPSVAPRGTLTFTATGGSGSGYAWSLTANPSGGSIDPSTGAYTAGATGGVADVVLVTDSLGNTATVNIAVTAGVSISPSTASVAPLGSQTFTASGGSGAGYAWSLTANPSGGFIDPSTGAYTAGTIGGVADIVQVMDSLGNLAAACVSVDGGACPL